MAKRAQRLHPDRGHVLDNAPLQYAPRNELGVVFLFAHLAKRFRIKIERIQPQFPDCIGYMKTGKGEKAVRIEFEYKSKSFLQHRHEAKHVDWIVCWEHNWPSVPKHIRVIELRKEYGLGFNVWVEAIQSPYKERLQCMQRSSNWSVPSLAQRGDLILFYSMKPDGFIADIFKLREPVRVLKTNHRQDLKGSRKYTRKTDYMAPITRVCKLKAPLFLEDLQSDRFLSTANFVRGKMQFRANASEYWPYLYNRILQRNPALARCLKKYAPDAI